MNKFLTYLAAMPPDARQAFATLVGASPNYLRHVSRGRKSVSLGMADAIVATSGGEIELDDLPLADDARHQRRVREGSLGAMAHQLLA